MRDQVFQFHIALKAPDISCATEPPCHSLNCDPFWAVSTIAYAPIRFISCSPTARHTPPISHPAPAPPTAAPGLPPAAR